MISPPDTLAADPKSLDLLRRHLRHEPDQGHAEVGRQFESLFIQIMLKNMRGGTLAPGAMDSDQGRFYQDMFDTQISSQLSRGKGLGIGSMITRQLDGQSATRHFGPHAPIANEPLGKSPFPHPPLNLPARPLKPIRADGFPLMNQPRLIRTPNPTADSDVLSAQPPIPLQASQPATFLHGPAATGNGDWPPRSPDAFIKALWPHAQRAAAELGVSPKAILAQAALESGWGKREIRHADGRPSFNLFGIKAGTSWQGAYVRVPTLEYSGAVSERRMEPFRTYDSLSEAFSDYVRLLKNNPRYHKALEAGADHGAFAVALQHAGYATDPHYAEKIQRIMATYMADLDPSTSGSTLA